MPNTSEPDKILIYSPFPSYNSFLRDVSHGRPASSDIWFSTSVIRQALNVHGIKFVEIYGSLSQAKRIQNLQNFMTADREGPRVLIISNVGSIGLNIHKANIVIFFVSSIIIELNLHDGTSNWFYCRVANGANLKMHKPLVAFIDILRQNL